MVTAVMHTHVDDVLVACNSRDQETVKALERIRKKLYMAVKPGTTFTYCGKRISQLPSTITVDQWPAAAAVEPIALKKEGMKQNEDPLTQEERTSYRSDVGQLMCLQTWTRPDLCTATSLAARRTEKATTLRS